MKIELHMKIIQTIVNIVVLVSLVGINYFHQKTINGKNELIGVYKQSVELRDSVIKVQYGLIDHLEFKASVYKNLAQKRSMKIVKYRRMIQLYVPKGKNVIVDDLLEE